MARNSIGFFPPNGWPMKGMQLCFAIISIFVAVLMGYKRIMQVKARTKKTPLKWCLATDDNPSMRSEVFDADSDTIVVDNSANCIIWRHKRDFVPKTYTKLDE